MKVFLSGYGKMGRMLEELALERGWDIVGHADITCPEAYETAPGADVCLDFSGVGALQPLLGYLHRTKTALVSGTTGLTEPDLDALQELGRELPVIWTANYSMGTAVFRRMLHNYAGVLAGWDKESWKPPQPEGRTRRAARQSSCCRSWTQRARRRSFTAARASAASAGRRRSACFPCAAARSRASIPSISSARTRRCRSRTAPRARRIFAAGALRAAQAICGRGPGFYTLDELLFEI